MTTALQFILKKEHGYLIITLGCIALHIIIIGFTKVLKCRRETFNRDFMKKHFEDLHKKIFDEDITLDRNNGYPDMGDGFYSQQLSYNQWLKFNKYQRTHYNYLEIIASILVVTLIAGLQFPCIASIFGFIFMIGRELYSQFYVTPQGTRHPLRQVGVLTAVCGWIVNFSIAVYVGVKFANLI